jgi:dihydrolipoamide dehydrogenase
LVLKQISKNIGLEEVGIATDKDKIVNAYNATNIPGYYAIGDVTQDKH